MGDKEMKKPEKRLQRKYNEEEKSKIIARMLPLENTSLRTLEAEFGISKSTLFSWKQKKSFSCKG
jgi:transposase-like protein